MHDDRYFLRRAVELADESIDGGGGPFGAVVVKGGKIVAEARNMVVHLNDPTAHAEITAIRQAALELKTFTLNGCTLYSSCEPCPMCFGAIYWAGIEKVVYASDRIGAEKAGFNDRFIYDEIVLDPSGRKITFLHLQDPASEEVFRKWEQSGNKIPY